LGVTPPFAFPLQAIRQKGIFTPLLSRASPHYVNDVFLPRNFIFTPRQIKSALRALQSIPRPFFSPTINLTQCHQQRPLSILSPSKKTDPAATHGVSMAPPTSSVCSIASRRKPRSPQPRRSCTASGYLRIGRWTNRKHRTLGGRSSNIQFRRSCRGP
jgi:hypothetical protein